MATRSEEFFHDKWLGMVQTESDGLVIAKPILIEAGCANHQPPEVQEKLRELCPLGPDESPRHITDLMQLFQQLLDFDAGLFDAAPAIPVEVSLYAPEGPQTIRPTFGIIRQDDPETREGTATPASRAAAKYIALIWDVTEIEGDHRPDAIGLPLDKPESTTGGWSYPAAVKFDRLLRHCRVPVGILTNRQVLRLVYAPHGQSSGHITFRVDDMATVGGRPILDGMTMLLCANQWFGVSDENTLPSLLRRSREYQGTVTEDLAEQVFNGLETLLRGFQSAAERDKSGLLREAFERGADHLYGGLLTVLLRLVFVLYAEDRNLLPVDHPLYAKHMSLLGLFERLQRDYGTFPDSMNNRFGAWGHIISLSRAIYLGAEHGDFHMPARQGDLFDPHRYPFLEGWSGGSAPIVTQTARADVKAPSIDDGTVFALLRSLLIFQGQRLNYRTLDVEQIGSVYEELMGYQVSYCESPAVAIKIKSKKGAPKYWVAPEVVQARQPSQRVKWLMDECGFEKPVALKIKEALDDVGTRTPGERNTGIEALLPLAGSKAGLSQVQWAGVGQYVFQPGSERRRSGTQYTPRALTGPIVRKTLAPLIRCLGVQPTADQLFSLKICDPAMGSGAFLVECCRQLADEVVAAWTRAHDFESIAANCPEGDVVAHARRLVTQRCLYGVDKNATAVQLAKLSLWLFTLARDLPFTFVDHSIRHGDSLVGLDLDQIKAFHWEPGKQLSFLGEEVKRALEEVVAIREEIQKLAGDMSPEGQTLKAQRLFDASDATEKVRRIADVCLGAFFAKVDKRARLAERQLREGTIQASLERVGEFDESIDLWVSQIRRQHQPFHWCLEFPEVFFEKRPEPLAHGGTASVAFLDGIVGNPPFIAGSSISSLFGDSYRDWLLSIHEGGHGNGDLSAHFFRRSSHLLGDHGTAGLIATNTISQGDTRTTGLKYLLAVGWRIYDAMRSMPWPGAAAVTISVVHLVRGAPMAEVQTNLNDRPVNVINSRLRPKPERPDAIPLTANSGSVFIGSKVYGQGFELLPGERKKLVERDPRNAERIFPYIGGAEVNSSPTQDFDRYVINFSDMSLTEAQCWPDLIEIARIKVKPERDKNKRAVRSKYWWRFGETTPALYRAISSLDRCLVNSSVTKHLVFTFQPTDRIFSHALYVYPLQAFTSFAVLQSRIHEPWAWLLSSTMKSDLRYSASDCFSNFPFPFADPRRIIADVEIAGKLLFEARATFMLETCQGLTKTYNALKNPECDDAPVMELRRLHEAMDRAVLDAYGWSDICVPPYCPMDEAEESAREAFHDDVIDRLYLLNSERAMEEERRGRGKKLSNKHATNLWDPEKASGVTRNLPGMNDAEWELG